MNPLSIAKKCSVCGVKILPQGIKNHITGQAKAEAFKQMRGFFTNNGHEVKFSRAVVLKNNPHFRFYYKNAKKMPKEKSFDLLLY